MSDLDEETRDLLASVNKVSMHTVFLSHKRIQLHARLVDLVPTEGPVIDGKMIIEKEGRENWEKMAADVGVVPYRDRIYASDFYPAYLKQLEENEMLPYKQLAIHSNGIIADGNYRFHGGRWAGLEYVPIDLDFFLCNTTDDLFRVLRQRKMVRSMPVVKTPVRHLEDDDLKDGWWLPKDGNKLDKRLKPGPPAFNYSLEEVMIMKEKAGDGE